MARILYNENDNLIIVDELQSGLTGDYRNDATVTVTLYDADLDPVAGATDISCVYQAASNGKYVGEIAETFNVPVGSYTAVVEAEEDGVVGKWQGTVKVKVRKLPA